MTLTRTRVAAVVVGAALALASVAGCSSTRTNNTPAGGSTSANAAGTLVGIAMPTKSLERWNRDGVEKGHPLASRTMLLEMGESKTVSFTAALPEGPLGPLEVRYSPTVTQTPVTVDASCAALFPAAE